MHATPVRGWAPFYPAHAGHRAIIINKNRLPSHKSAQQTAHRLYLTKRQKARKINLAHFAIRLFFCDHPTIKLAARAMLF